MTEPSEAQPKRRWLLPLLFVSLALNLMIVGIAVGWGLSHRGGPDGRDPRELRGTLGEPFFRALPEDSRRALIRDIGENRDRFRENRESLRARVQDFLAALRADPFDAEAVARLLDEQRTVALGRQELGEELLVKRLAEMTQAERNAYADRMEALLSRLKRRD